MHYRTMHQQNMIYNLKWFIQDAIISEEIKEIVETMAVILYTQS